MKMPYCLHWTDKKDMEALADDVVALGIDEMEAMVRDEWWQAIDYVPS